MLFLRSVQLIHACDPSTLEAEAGALQVRGRPGIVSQTGKDTRKRGKREERRGEERGSRRGGRGLRKKEGQSGAGLRL